MPKRALNVFRSWSSLIAAITVVCLASCVSSSKKTTVAPETVAAADKKPASGKAQPEVYKLDKDAVFSPMEPEGITAVYVEASVDEVAADYIPMGEEAAEAKGIFAFDVPTPSRPSPEGEGKGYFSAASASSPRSETAGLYVQPPIPGAPALTSSFDTTDFDTNSANTGGFVFIPPDPIGAAGPSHLVNVVNVTVRFH